MKLSSAKPSMDMTASMPLVRRMVDSYLRPHLWTLLTALFLMFLSAATTGAMAKLMEPITDNVFSSKNPDLLWPVAFIIIAVFLVRGFATYGHTVLMNKLGQRVVSNMQKDMFGHLVHADLSYFHGQQSGHLLSRFTTDMALVRAAVTESMTGIGKNTFTLIFLIAVMFNQDWKLATGSLVIFPMVAYAVMRLGKKLRRTATSMQEQTGTLTGTLNQIFQGNKHVKAYGMEEFEKGRVNNTIETIFSLMYKVFRTSAVATPIAEILSGIAVVTIVVYGGYQVIAGETTQGKLFSFISAFLLAFEPMKRLAKLNNVVQMGLAAIDRLFKLIDITPSIHNKPDAKELKVTSPIVTFEDVGFTYVDGTDALRGVSFEVPAGKTVALVGESGAGKSTTLNLIPRFYDVTSGAIKIDGHDIREVTLESLRRNMALVSQEVAIFDDTVRDNIAYGTRSATQEQIEEAARAAVAHDFIMELPQGYDTVVGENGVKLSGGQRQRIAIARAMLRNAPILLLDEATSSLDANSERLVQTALERLEKGKTTIVVAHRLSTVMNADIIFVFDDGRIVESGNHAELLQKKGVYARLYGTLLKETA